MSTIEEALAAGVVVYNAGEHHAAHDAWEDEWLALDAGTADERFLHGLIQFTAAVYHGRRRNWSGAGKLARSAREYLAGLDRDYRGVDLTSVRDYLRRLGDDPEYAERARPLELRYDGQVLAAVDLEIDALGVAAAVVAEEYEAEFDEALVERAVGYAREEADTARSRFRALLCDFIDDADRRALVYDRLRDHVRRRRREEEDVDGLFE